MSGPWRQARGLDALLGVTCRGDVDQRTINQFQGQDVKTGYQRCRTGIGMQRMRDAVSLSWYEVWRSCSQCVVDD